MRWHKTVLAATALMVIATLGAAPSQAADVSFGFFYSSLGPHGSWLASAEYGRVWQPHVVVADWNPYYDGHWVYTDLGWTWVSDYPWGAIPYHYGTWVLDANFGWVWVPGYVWAPSWVVFRTGPDYIGWAPVSPRYTVGISLRSSHLAGGPFVFVSARNFLAPRVRTSVIPRHRAIVILNQTRVVNNLVVENNVVVNRGPEPRLIENATGRRLREVRIERVRGAAPGAGFDRASLRVDSHRMQRGPRAAEPAPVEKPSRRAPRRQIDSSRPDRAGGRPDQVAPAPRSGRQGVQEAPRPRPGGRPGESVTPSTGKKVKPNVQGGSGEKDNKGKKPAKPKKPPKPKKPRNEGSGSGTTPL